MFLYLQIMDKLLDKEVNTHYKAPSLVTYLNTRIASNTSSNTAAHPHSHANSTSTSSNTTPTSVLNFDSSTSLGTRVGSPSTAATGMRASHQMSGHQTLFVPDRLHHHHGGNGQGEASGADALLLQSLPPGSGGISSNGGARPKTTYSLRYNR